MPALGFKKRFKRPIQRRVKRQTIRNFRKIPIKGGDHLFLFTAMRTAQCEKIGEATCTDVEQIELHHNCVKFYLVDFKGGRWAVMRQPEMLDSFARLDGFKSWDDLKAYWVSEHGEDCFPYHGELIKFDLLPKKRWKKLSTKKAKSPAA